MNRSAPIEYDNFIQGISGPVEFGCVKLAIAIFFEVSFNQVI